ncbi:MAG: hypothetical protein Q8Q07_03735 [Dehalococcoidales bacterium]|nr:hypothetical protein [Dehalococcoidales bacterium]
MPIVERDPWRNQYFEDVSCPEDLVIPTDDELAYELYEEHRWVYNKVLICRSQGIECGTDGAVPSRFPVFGKPVQNLRGMGIGTGVITTPAELRQSLDGECMWMRLLEGEHISSDVAVIQGKPVWWRHTKGIPAGRGTFDYWVVQSGTLPAVEESCGEWIEKYLAGYSGMINLETIGGLIIDCHLRFSDQFVDLYGVGWLESVIGLYSNGEWYFDDASRRTGYSVVLWGRHGMRYHHPDRKSVSALLEEPEVSSIQITFHEDSPPEAHAMPPGGFRLSVINCWNLNAGKRVRRKLALLFGL